MNEHTKRSGADRSAFQAQQMGPGPQPYPPGQQPRVAAETLGGTAPEAAPVRAAKAQAALDETIVVRHAEQEELVVPELSVPARRPPKHRMT